MNFIKKTYTCFVCGSNQLDFRPYKESPEFMVDTTILKPPYSQYWGMGSYGNCDCCSFEFGADDEPRLGEGGDSFEDARKYWIEESNCEWWWKETKPKNWDPYEQMQKAGLPFKKK